MLYVRVLIQIGTGYCILDPPPPLLFEETGCVAVVLSSFWFGRGCISVLLPGLKGGKVLISEKGTFVRGLSFWGHFYAWFYMWRAQWENNIICLPKKKTIQLWSEYHIIQQASNNKQMGRSGNQAVWSVGGKEHVIYWLSGQPGAKEGKVQTNQDKVLRLAKEA